MVSVKLRAPIKEQLKFWSHRINLAIVGLVAGWFAIPAEWKEWVLSQGLAIFGALALGNSVVQNLKQSNVTESDIERK